MGQENPHTVVEILHTLRKSMAWCGMHKNEMSSAFAFSESNTTGENYNRVYRLYVMPRIPDLPTSSMFQQDDAPAHWSLDVRSYLNMKFP